MLYDLAIAIYDILVHLAAPFSRKPRKMMKGHWVVYELLRQQVEKGEQYIWFHAASLGEFEQGRPLIEMIREKYPDYKILLTFFSPSGYEVRKHYRGADIVCYLPFDKPRNVKKFLDIANPCMAFFIKYEFWKNYLDELHKRRIPVYSVSSIFRREQIFFKWYGGTYRNVLKDFDHLFVQNEASKRYLSKIGISRVTVVGDTRFDRVLQIREEAKELPLVEKFKGNNSFSTHLALEENNRVESAKQLTDLAKTYNKVVYMAGDFNEDLMNGTFFTELKKEWEVVSSTENTFPTGQATKRIDFVVTLKTPPTIVVKSNVIYNLDGVNVAITSDHYPLYCDFKKPTGLEEYPKAEGDLRIGNYFLTYCKGTDGVIDYDRTGRIIAKMNADIVCLQGLDKETERSEGIDQLNVLAQKANMHDYFAKAIDYKGGEFGVGILTKEEPVSVDRYQMAGKSEMRAAMVVEYEKFVVASTNFDTDMAKRIEALQTLETKLSAYNKPAFLLGYFNEGDLESEFFQMVKSNWNLLSADKSTEVSGKKRRLDFIVSLKSHNVNVTQADVIENLSGVDVTIASTHYPLFCDFSGLK